MEGNLRGEGGVGGARGDQKMKGDTDR